MKSPAPYGSPIGVMASIILMLISSSHVWAEGKTNPFPDVEYAYAKAYLFNIEEDSNQEHIYGPSGWARTKFGDGETIKQAQLKALHRAVNRDPDILLMGLAKCFIPRHGVVYFDQEDQPVAALSICFQCQGMRFFPEPKDEGRFRMRVGREKMRMARKDLKDMEMVMKDIGLPVSENLQEYAQYVSTKRSGPQVEGVITIIDDSWVQKTIGDAPDLDSFQKLVGNDLSLKPATVGTKGKFFAEGVVLSVKAPDQSLVAASIRNPQVALQGIHIGSNVQELGKIIPDFPLEQTVKMVVIRSAKTGYAVSLKMNNALLEEIRIEWIDGP